MNDSDPQQAPLQPAIVRRGAVAVIKRDNRLLLIRRSVHVIAAGQFCFPGGGLEPGESESEALVRELQEELNCRVQPLVRLWETVTPWRVHLAWWRAALEDDAAIVPNPLEVESVHWLTPAEILAIPDLLSGNRQFVEAVARGEVRLR